MQNSYNEMKRSPIQKEISNLMKVLFYILSFILLGLIFGFLTFKILSFSRTVEVPDLYGKSSVDASKLLREKGLNLKIEGEDYDSSILPGHILKQDVPAKKRLKKEGASRLFSVKARESSQYRCLLLKRSQMLRLYLFRKD
jgi:hypothetical protein